MAREVRVVAFAGSIRVGSMNAAVLDHAVKLIEGEDDVIVDRIDLANYPLPLYNADDQNNYGIPDPVYRLAERIEPSDALLIASPEYNGGYTPLFKNTIDWVSRVDRSIFEGRTVGIITASKSRVGGARSASQMVELFAYMRSSVHDPTLNVAHALDHLGAGHVPGLEEWTRTYIAAARRWVDTASD